MHFVHTPIRHRRAIKTNIADSLNVIVQIERRPGYRFVSEVLEILGFEPQADTYEFREVHVSGRCKV